jgi:dihydroorotate dehydrogenase (fumarate)
VAKYLLVGADAVMTTSALLRNGVGYMATLVVELARWLEARGFASVAAMQGIMNQLSLDDPQAFERANYIKILQGYGR